MIVLWPRDQAQWDWRLRLSCSSTEEPELLSLEPEVLSPSLEVQIHQDALLVALLTHCTELQLMVHLTSLSF